VLDGIDNLEFVHLGEADVVRNQIVRDIVVAYDRIGSSKQG
jgi:phosphate starvation-inducible protein PhoH